MRFAAARCAGAASRAERIFVSLERNMKCARRLLRPLPARARRSSARTGRCSPTIRVAAPRRAAGALSRGRAPQAQARRLEVRLLRRLPAHRCSTARTSCSRVAGAVEIAHFLEASRAVVQGPVRPLARRGVDHHAARRRAHPRRSAAPRRHLVTIGACATAGGIQALRNFGDVKEFTSIVYARPEYITTLDRSTPIAAHVPVDFELRGCPIDKRQLLEVISAFLHGRRPNTPDPQRLRRVQAARQRLRDGRARHALPRAGHARRLRRALPRLRPRLLRLLRPAGDAEHGRRSHAGGRGSGVVRVRTSCAPSGRFNAEAPRRSGTRARPQRRTAGVSRRRTRTITVDYLARVEGEGALTITRPGRPGRSTSQLRIFEPPRFFEAFLRGRAFTEAPDITARICGICPVAYQMSAVHAHRGRPRRAGRRPAARAAPPALLRRVDREPRAARLSCCTRRTSSATPTPSRMAARPPRGWSSAACAQEGRQRDRRRCSAGARSIRSTCASAASTASRRGPSSRRWPSDSSGRATRRSRRSAGSRRFAVPGLRARLRVRRAAPPDEYPINEGRIVSSRGLDIAARDYDAHFVEEQVPHSNALHSTLRGRGAYLCGPLARFTLNFDRLSPLAPRGGARGRARPGRAATRSRASSCARSRCCRRATRRCASSTPTSRRDAPVRRRRPHAPRPATRAPRRRAACSTTATGSTPTARSSTPRSCRRPRRTRDASRRISRASCPRACALPDADADAGVRAGGPQLRPVHLLRDALPHRADRARHDAAGPRASRSGRRPRATTASGLAVLEALRRARRSRRRRARASATEDGALVHAARDRRPRWSSSTPCSADARRRGARARAGGARRARRPSRSRPTASASPRRSRSRARWRPTRVSPAIRIVGVTIAPPARYVQGLSPAVAAAVPRAVARVLALVGG